MPLKRFTHSEHSEKIVAAAAKLFARQGYRATSTRGIARLAGVSENTLFRHFDHKENVFWSALRSEAATLKPQWDCLEGIRAAHGPEVVLPEVLEFLIKTVTSKPEMLRLFGVAFLELKADPEIVCFDSLAPVFSEFSSYLASSIKKGDVLEVDPTLLAAAFLAMVLVFPQISSSKGKKFLSCGDEHEALQACSKFWLDLLSPRPRVRANPNLGSERLSST